ncbi:DUF982 domain-containing protein [Neorhizobium lilium]|uniref:DUF982 domain-containing protein n=2 Tax=Neorhizobium lilium TaxID=2503024 RepID=A0A444LNG8_9HYPH|nr:DUF982 domain-containing protein [Neorhizobium lilium]RWX81889.1 DUF982 domain-containing protein [Neorhizobium lilium]
MDHDLWDRPIEVAIESGDHFKSIRNSREAVAYLMTCWPKRGGESFTIAKRVCMDAVEGRSNASAAEVAFRLAARDAGILR